jgi:hypothetical protein
LQRAHGGAWLVALISILLGAFATIFGGTEQEWGEEVRFSCTAKVWF